MAMQQSLTTTNTEDDFPPFRLLDLPYEIRAKILGKFFEDGWKAHQKWPGRFYYPMVNSIPWDEYGPGRYRSEYEGLAVASHQVRYEFMQALISSKMGTMLLTTTTGADRQALAHAPQWFDLGVSKVTIEPSPYTILDGEVISLLRARFVNLQHIEYARRGVANSFWQGAMAFDVRDVVQGKCNDRIAPLLEAMVKEHWHITPHMLGSVVLASSVAANLARWYIPVSQLPRRQFCCLYATDNECYIQLHFKLNDQGCQVTKVCIERSRDGRIFSKEQIMADIDEAITEQRHLRLKKPDLVAKVDQTIGLSTSATWRSAPIPFVSKNQFA